MNHDFIRLANEMKNAHAQGVPLQLPAMTARDLGTLIGLLLADTPTPAQLH